jgi:cell wall-associated NlpC family hydrolase
MAPPITKREISRLPRVPYEQVRDLLRTGDLVFCSGSYAFSRIVQAFTRSVWSHVGIVYRDEKLRRVFVLESETGIGVRLAPLSKYLLDYHGRRRPYRGQIVVARVGAAVDDEGLRRLISAGMDELTRPYDNLEILRIALRILFRASRRTHDRRYICSELVELCYRQAGVRFRLRDNFVSPIDIWLDPSVEPGQRIL